MADKKPKKKPQEEEAEEKKDDLLGDEEEAQDTGADDAADEAEEEAEEKPAAAKPGKKKSVAEGGALPAGVKEKVDPAAFHKEAMEATKKKLWAGVLTNFIIPLADGEKVGTTESVSINGYTLTIQKGAMVEIPMAMANILAQHYRVAMTAGQDMAIGRKQEVTDALS